MEIIISSSPTELVILVIISVVAGCPFTGCLSSMHLSSAWHGLVQPPRGVLSTSVCHWLVQPPRGVLSTSASQLGWCERSLGVLSTSASQ